MSDTLLEQPLGSNYNNQSLFSDHYLDHTLHGNEAWKRAFPKAQAFLAWLRDLYAQEKDQFADYHEAQLEEVWFTKIFEKLGHTWQAQAVIPAWKGNIKKPDYVFFPDEDARKTAVSLQNSTDYAKSALAIGEVKQWGISLDKNRADAPVFDDVNPMYQIDSYLTLTKLDWGILSNGRQWRLLYREESRSLDNYFEIDLLAMLEQSDEKKASVTATYFWLFFNQDSFRANTQGQLFLRDVYEQSLLYKRDLETDLRGNAYRALEQLILGFFNSNPTLDANNSEHRADVYRNSLYLLYRLLFLFYGESRALLPINNIAYQTRYSLQKIVKQLNRNAKNRVEINSLPVTGRYYWHKLSETFRLISGVDKALNIALDVPRYNGGLFDAQQHLFLENHIIGDHHLMQAIDYLATRRIDSKNGKPKYETVDYATLDVRQLGSIYEGLLEYKVAIAREEMVTISKKGVETWVPLAQKGKAKRFGNPRQIGELYLTTDKGERKATGSYYTPDYIVEYIVENTLEPLVAQVRENVADGSFSDGILRLNVLDPAMGSGHFLVEAMNYLAREIVAEMPSSMQLPGSSDLLYWKRRVVEACIYGVDKNPMAVELAKLSLWLKTAVADKPLSFLDHHLQHGDSLIGASLDDLSKSPIPSKSVAVSANQKSLIDDSAFTYDVGLAVGGVMAIERATSDTIEDVHLKEKIWAELQRKHIGSWRLLADVWVSTFFGNTMSREEYRALADRLQGRDSLMSDAQAKRLLNHPAVTDNDYFHWQFIFPEVFFDEYGKPLKEAEGFDAVIGNPPWGGKIDTVTYAYLKNMYSELHQRLPDTMKYFFGVAHKNIKKGGLLGQILTNVVLFAHEYTNLRHILFENYVVHNIVNLGDGIFPDVTAPSCIIVAKESHEEDSAIDIQDLRNVARSEELLNNLTPIMVKQSLLKEIPNYTVVGSVSGLQLLTRLYQQSKQVNDLASQISLGVHSGHNSAFILTQEDARQKMIEKDVQWSLLTGSDIGRYVIPERTNQIILYVEWDFNASNHPHTIHHLENFKAKLAQRREAKQGTMPWYSLHWARNRQLYESPKIICRQTADNLVVTVDPYGHCALNSTIIIKPDSSQWSLYFWASIMNSKLMHFVYSLLVQEDGRTFAEVKPVNLRKLPIKNIDFTTEEPQRTAVSTTTKTLYQQADYPALLNLVAAELAANRNDTIHDLLAFLAEQMIDMNKQKQVALEAFWLDLEGVIEPAAFDTLRNKGKWEKSLHKAVPAARPFVNENSRSSVPLSASLSWNEEAFKGFVKLLVKNIRYFSTIVGVYRDHETAVSSLDRQLTATDRLIDQIVYQLYGLTDEEIVIVEG